MRRIYNVMRERLSGNRVHFIGVGGISMSALIRIARNFGAVTSGSDRAESEAFRSLEKEGYNVYLGVRPELAASADLVVWNAAIKPDHPELVAAGDKAIGRAEFLADICRYFKRTVAVAGTHGKTTVSAMIGCCALAGGTKFSAHIGGVVRNFDGNTFLAGDDLFITEACEYKDSFLTLSPDLAIILNVTDGCLLHCLFIAVQYLCIPYASRTYIVSYITLYILCIYPVI